MTDFNRLRLAANGNPERLDQILQLEGRHRFARKLPIFCECDATRFPDLLAGEQATSEALARVHADMVGPVASVIDLTCGLGIDSFEFARRGAKVTAIDLDPARACSAQANARALGLDINVINADSLQWLRTYNGTPADLIIVDPARRGQGGKRLYSLADCSPDITGEIDSLLSHGVRVLVKASPMLDPSLTQSQLGNQADILAIGTRREVKELTALLPAQGRLGAFVEGNDTTLWLPETATETSFRNPEPGMKLYEPWPPVMKAGRFNALAHLTTTYQIAPNTHLYISIDKINFPGECFEIEKVVEMSKQAFRELRDVEASVSVRNFPMRAEELTKRLKAKESDKHRLFGITTQEGKKILILATR